MAIKFYRLTHSYVLNLPCRFCKKLVVEKRTPFSAYCQEHGERIIIEKFHLYDTMFLDRYFMLSLNMIAATYRDCVEFETIERKRERF